MEFDYEEPIIILNKIRTPDGTELISRYNHDYVSYKDNNGNVYVVDGGNSYLRRSGPGDYTELSIVYNDNTDWELVRENFNRGVRDPNNDIKWIPLYKLSNNHIENIIIDYSIKPNQTNNTIWIYENEIEYRKKHSIVLADYDYFEDS